VPGFKRSTRFGFIGFAIVVVLIIVIALTVSPDDADPKLQLLLILGITFAFMAGVMFLQGRDLDGVEAARKAAAPVQPGPVEDAGTATIDQLITELAIAPIDPAAAEASSDYGLRATRESIDSGKVMLSLIVCATVPFLVFRQFWSMYIFVPVIFSYALYLAGKATGPGGTLDQGYDLAAQQMKALGLTMTEHPRVEMKRRLGNPRVRSRLRGALVYGGVRHGRTVSVRVDAEGEAVTSIEVPAPPFKAGYKDKRLRAAPGGPRAVSKTLGALTGGEAWKGVELDGEGKLITATREHDHGNDWMRDLWLLELIAERLENP